MHFEFSGGSLCPTNVANEELSPQIEKRQEVGQSEQFFATKDLVIGQ